MGLLALRCSLGTMRPSAYENPSRSQHGTSFLVKYSISRSGLTSSGAMNVYAWPVAPGPPWKKTSSGRSRPTFSGAQTMR